MRHHSSPSDPIRLLLVEDSEDDATLILRELKRSDLVVACRRVETEEALARALSEEPWDAVVSDFSMPQLSGPRAVELVRKFRPDVPCILVSGSVGERLAVEAMRAGAQDYLLKEHLARLPVVVSREIAEAAERARRREIEAEVREKEKQLAVAQRLEAIGRLAGGVAHDLNNMIGACALHAEVALDPSQGPDEVRECVREIVKAQQRAARLVRQLLAFSSRQVIAPQVLSLNQVVADARKVVSRMLGEAVVLTLDLAEGLHPVRVDPAQIEQILMNLVVNSKDAMPKGGRLLIQTANEEAVAGHWLLRTGTNRAPGRFVRLTVSDDGTGMSEKVQARLFEPFFTTKDIGQGTGLGLATVFGMVKQARGDIRVTSEPGKGTAFDIFLQAVDEPLPVRPPPSESPPRALEGGPRTLLLVEDDAIIRRALQRALGNLGYEVHSAVDGEEGLRLFDALLGRVDLLVSDVVMPALSGPDMAKRMWARKPSLKVLFLSGYNADALGPYLEGHDGYYLLPKPFSTQEFTRKVAELLEPRSEAR